MTTPTCTIDAADERLELLPERGVHWARTSTLFIADLHVGKDEALRAGGLPIPPGTSEDDLARLTAVVRRTAARRLVVLGDFLHARASRSPEILGLLRSWREAHPDLDVLLIRGNHDLGAGDPPADLRIEVVDEPHLSGPFHLVHDPAVATAPAARYVLAGHLHPAIRLRGPGADRLKTPAFVERRRGAGRVLLLPAFSTFTGGARVEIEPDDRVWAADPSGVIRVPVRARRY